MRTIFFCSPRVLSPRIFAQFVERLTNKAGTNLASENFELTNCDIINIFEHSGALAVVLGMRSIV